MSARPIGGLRRRLTLEAPVDVADDIGGVTRGFAAVATLWGDIHAVTGARLFVAERPEENITHLVRIRYREGLTGAMRLRLGARILNIRAVHDVDERRRYLQCHCREVKP